LSWVALDSEHVDILGNDFDDAVLGDDDVVKGNGDQSVVPCRAEYRNEFAVAHYREPIDVLESGFVESVLVSGLIVRGAEQGVVDNVPPEYDAPLVRVAWMGPLRESPASRVVCD